MARRYRTGLHLLVLSHTITTVAVASELGSPESAVREMIRANAEKDLPTRSRMMAHDTDIIRCQHRDIYHR
jgi:hypothetical protein